MYLPALLDVLVAILVAVDIKHLIDCKHMISP